MSEHDIQIPVSPQDRKAQLQEQLDQAEMRCIFNLMASRGGAIITLGLTGVTYISSAQGSVPGMVTAAFVGATGAVVSWNRYQAAQKARQDAEDLRSGLDRIL